MPVDPNPPWNRPFARSLRNRDLWIPIAWGAVAAWVTVAIAGLTGFEYQLEALMAAFNFVVAMVSSHRNGILRTKPVLAIGAALLGGAISATVMYVFT